MGTGSGWRALVGVALGLAMAACSLTNLDDLKGAGGPDAGGGTGGSAGAGTGGGSDGGSCVPLSCADVAAECGKITDGCGGIVDCGGCASSKFCGGAGPNKCGDTPCVPATCAAANAECGGLGDGCGDILDCGTCSSPTPVCNTSNKCTTGACTPTTCQAASAECGTLADGCGKALDCGMCSGSKAQCVANRCVCDVDSCASLGLNCGAAADGCGKTLNCGTCTGKESCVSGSCQDVVTTACGACPAGFTSAATAPDPACGPVGGVCPAVNIRSLCVKAGVASQAYCGPGSCPPGTHLGLSTFHCACGSNQIHLCVAD